MFIIRMIATGLLSFLHKSQTTAVQVPQDNEAELGPHSSEGDSCLSARVSFEKSVWMATVIRTIIWLPWTRHSSKHFKVFLFFEVHSTDNNIYTCELQVNEL